MKDVLIALRRMQHKRPPSKPLRRSMPVRSWCAMVSRNSGCIPISELPKTPAYLFEHPLILLKRPKYGVG